MQSFLYDAVFVVNIDNLSYMDLSNFVSVDG